MVDAVIKRNSDSRFVRSGTQTALWCRVSAGLPHPLTPSPLRREGNLLATLSRFALQAHLVTALVRYVTTPERTI
jgi:hypothetical protein